MSGLQISQMPVATTPLSSTDIFPLVQVTNKKATVADVAAASVMAPSAFTPAGTGSVPRSVAAKLNETVSVMDFGAIGDGVADDTAAFILTAAALNPIYGGTFYIPKGRWLLSGGITIAAPNVVVCGAGPEASKILIASHTFDAFTTIGAGEVTFRGFSVTAFATTAISKLVIRDGGPGNGTYRMRLKDVFFSGVHSGVYSTGAEFYASDVRMYGLRVGAGIGFNFAGTSEVKTLRDCYVQNAIGSNAVAGVLIQGGSSFVMDNVECIAMSNPFWVSPPVSAVVFSLKMNGCWADNGSGIGILLNGVTGAIHRVTIDNSWASSCGVGIQVKGTVTGLSIQGTEVFANSSTGIDIVSGAVITGAVIAGNRVAGNGGAGISIAANVGGFTLASNVIGPAADFGANLFGIYLDTGTSNNYLIQGNRLRGNTNSGLVDGGSGVNKSVTGNLI